MDFDVTKENIQPLRGGRNVHQLGMALQAQHSREFQQELHHQREEFENAIRNYEGDDPLDLYYNYISWVEQSYPKSGHEGNFVPLLEHCLAKFENDKRYSDDRRFCRLWIKYIDLQSNPLELYHMMHAKGLCVRCADLYKAWAYYHEAASDFQSAHNVFESGKMALAEPYDELETAHKNLVIAAGQHTIFGPDETRLVEKRAALTTLHTYKPGRVGSVRVPSSSGAGTLPSTSATNHRHTNVPIQVYDSSRQPTEPLRSGAEAAPNSIITAARRLEAPKENTMKPGPWTTVPVKKRSQTHKTAAFTVHEDGVDDVMSGGLRMPPNYPRETREDYSKWRVNVTIPDPVDHRMVPMYPKHRVYIDPNTEYSIEELRAHRYMARKSRPCAMDGRGDGHGQFLTDSSLNSYERRNIAEPSTSFVQYNKSNTSVSNVPNLSQQFIATPPMAQQVQVNRSLVNTSTAANVYSHNPFQYNDPIILTAPTGLANTSRQLPTNTLSPNNLIWGVDSPDVQIIEPKKFVVYEESIQEVPRQPKGMALKTPIKTLNADDLVETGSRGGMDIAATAQPTDSAKPMPAFSDDSSSPFDNRRNNPRSYQGEFNDTVCNTQMFNFNLNTMNVSTPQDKQMAPQAPAPKIPSPPDVGATRKQLFTEPTAPTYGEVCLSTILEETKSDGSSSSSSKSSTTHTNTPKPAMCMETISEEHNNYLAQNLMANAALRRSLLGEIMEFDSQPMIGAGLAAQAPPNPYPEVVTIPDDDDDEWVGAVRITPSPAVVAPLTSAPSDPFRPSVINQLLEVVQFPGPHDYGFIGVVNIPKLAVRKEAFSLGHQRYLVEKQLGKGTFGTVFKAIDLATNKVLALKHQRPANKWEFYICRELQSRLADNPMRERFMDISLGYFSEQSSILVSDYMAYGSLLDIANILRQKSGRTMKESLCIYFCIEMLRIVQVMHSVKIIHADIKPDNFLAFLQPDGSIGLQLIDFGCSIDMTLFPPDTHFTRKVATEDFVCCEMRDNRPWNYHTDLFCIAATTYVLLFDKYIRLTKKDGQWSINDKMCRYWKIDLWNIFFNSLLNQQSGPANTVLLQNMLDEALSSMTSDFMTEMRYLTNILKKR